MSRIAYFRVSTGDQSVEAQRKALGDGFDKEFADEGISGATKAEDRPGFAALKSYVREGDVICVTAIDRLGRDALDVQKVVRDLINEGIVIDVLGLGPIAKGVGELIVAVLAQMADMERNRIKERCEAGRAAARASLATTGKTHRGKASLGRPVARDASEVRNWRRENGASIRFTARHFRISEATVKRYCSLSTNSA
ncbi:recombinase family protein [Sphingosinithalassobacter portus]|uniref:recombinase family protein n=1 Tax=Stakelama portus TaxID=2676234 RepID=UPI000D6E68CF|nr:recombinase family protein [Sphingosinithalassobacter portus]